MIDALALTSFEITYLAAVCFVAGIVRGFTGFGQSAVAMASAALVLPPVLLIPILWWIELAASLLMLKGGWKDADKGMATTLWIGSVLGLPLGLMLTTTLPAYQSQCLALIGILVLAVLQLAKINLTLLQGRYGLVLTGIAAGIMSGIAHIGGMVIALYTLNSNKNARQMRASLTLYLFLGAASGFIFQSAFSMMDSTAILRGLVFAIPSTIGVLIGSKLFNPKFEPYYRPICLFLVIGLALFGLFKLA